MHIQTLYNKKKKKLKSIVISGTFLQKTGEA